MQLSTLIIALAASTSAIDIRLHSNSDCRGSWVSCSNINPGVCCTGDDWYGAAGFHAIPSGWTLRTESFASANCGRLFESWTSGDNRDKCMTGGSNPIYSGRYHFASKKRTTDACPAEESGCISQRPDLLALEDGKRYDISQMKDNEREALIELAFNGTTTEGIPAIYERFAT